MKIPGFSYESQRSVAHERCDWQQMLEGVVARGGHRRVEKGETFAHDEKGLLLFEVYANIQLDDGSDLL